MEKMERSDHPGTTRTLNVALAAFTALAVLPAGSSAQSLSDWDRPTVDFEFRTGVSTPAGEFSRYAQPGYYGGVGVAFWLNDRLAVRADGDFHSLGGAETRDRLTPMPDMRLWHGSVGIEYNWTHADPSPVTFQTSLGVGGSQLNTDFYEGPTGEVTDTQEAYPTVTLGVDVGLPITPDIRFVFGSKGHLGITDEEELADLASVNPAAEPTDQLVTFAHSLGLRIDLPN